MLRSVVKTKWLMMVVFLSCILLMTGQAAACDTETNPDIVQLQILTVNDFHGALVENGKNPGAAKLVQFLHEAKAELPEGTLIVSAGDMFQGSSDSNLLFGKSVVFVMNYAGFDAMTLGNHEFDWGIDVLKQRIVQSDFPYVCANVIDKRTGKTADFVKPYTIVERSGVKIGIIGIATPETVFKVNPKLIAGYTFADPVQTVNALVPVLRQQGVDIIIVISHLSGFTKENGEVDGDAIDLTWKTEGISAIVSGHSHQFVSAIVSGVPIVQAGYNGRAVGKVELLYDKANRQIDASSVAVIKLSYPDLAADPEVQALLEEGRQEVAAVKEVVIGQNERALGHDRNERDETLLGQWVTDQMRQVAQADVAFQNMGGLRTGLAQGTVTMGSLYEVMPFDNTLVTVTMTGEQIRKALEQGLWNGNAGVIQYSGLKVVCDMENRQLVSVTLADGAPLGLNKTYKVVINDFMASGGDGFIVFQAGRNYTDTGIPVRDMLADAIRKQQVIDFAGDNRLERYIRKRNKEKTPLKWEYGVANRLIEISACFLLLPITFWKNGFGTK